MVIDSWALIFARGGSKGLPGKNTKVLGGKPLLAYSIDVARQVKAIKRVLVSTDDDGIAGLARELGAEVPFIRPPELSQDDSPEWLAWQHALSWLEQHDRLPECFVSLPVTAPLRLASDVEACLAALDDRTDIVVTVTEAQRSPWFNIIIRDKRGYCQPVIKDQPIYRRQDAPKVYDMTTVAYVARPGFIMQHEGMFSGRVRAVEIPRERAVDIDSPLDFEWAEFLLRRQR